MEYAFFPPAATVDRLNNPTTGRSSIAFHNLPDIPSPLTGFPRAPYKVPKGRPEIMQAVKRSGTPALAPPEKQRLPQYDRLP